MIFRNSHFCMICVPTHHIISPITPRMVLKLCMALTKVSSYITKKFHDHVRCRLEDMMIIRTSRFCMICVPKHHHIFPINLPMVMKLCLAFTKVPIYISTKFHDHVRCRLEDMMSVRTSRFCKICVPTHHHISPTTSRMVMKLCMALLKLHSTYLQSFMTRMLPFGRNDDYSDFTLLHDLCTDASSYLPKNFVHDHETLYDTY